MRDFFLKEVSCFPCMFSLVENKHNVHVQQHPSQEKHRLTDKLYQKKKESQWLGYECTSHSTFFHHYQKEEKPPITPSGLSLDYSDSS